MSSNSPKLIFAGLVIFAQIPEKKSTRLFIRVVIAEMPVTNTFLMPSHAIFTPFHATATPFLNVSELSYNALTPIIASPIPTNIAPTGFAEIAKLIVLKLATTDAAIALKLEIAANFIVTKDAEIAVKFMVITPVAIATDAITPVNEPVKSSRG
jgi:hypothetical protein